MRKAIRFFFGVFVFAVILHALDKVLINKDGADILHTFHDEPENSLDVLLVGASSCYRFYSSPELWHDYGIASYNLGTSEQSLSQSYYVLKYALEYQEPQVVVVDLSTGLRLREPYNIARVHQVMDNLKKNAVWFEMLDVYADEGNRMEFLFPLTLYHSRWKELKETDFIKVGRDNKGISYNLMTEAFDGFQVAPDDYFEEVADEVYDYLGRIETLCQEKNVELLFVISPTHWISYDEEGAKVQGWINTLCADKGFEDHFLNLCDYIDETGLDFSRDYSDGMHVNIAGAMKITDFLGKYLTENYELPDRRSDSAYDGWNISYDGYCQDWAHRMEQAKIAAEYKEYYQEIFFRNK